MIDVNALNMYGAMAATPKLFTGNQSNVVLIDPMPGRRIIVWAWELSCESPAEVQFKSDTSEEIGARKWLTPGAGIITDMSAYRTAQNSALCIDVTCTGRSSVAVWYTYDGRAN